MTHEHKHHHDHDHDHEHHDREHHDHEHDTHREELDLARTEAYLEAHTHEEASTVSMAFCPHEGESLAFSQVEGLMQTVATEVEARGGIVGHIKGFAREEGAFAHSSVTAASLLPEHEGDLDRAFGPEADIQLAVIALLIDLDELLNLCKDALEQLN